jgi:transposase-like protein
MTELESDHRDLQMFRWYSGGMPMTEVAQRLRMKHSAVVAQVKRIRNADRLANNETAPNTAPILPACRGAVNCAGA